MGLYRYIHYITERETVTLTVMYMSGQQVELEDN